MKTSNKLLLGLIIAIFLMATVFLGVVKYYHITNASGMEHNSEEDALSLSTSVEAESRELNIYFPINVLLPPLQLR